MVQHVLVPLYFFAVFGFDSLIHKSFNSTIICCKLIAGRDINVSLNDILYTYELYIVGLDLKVSTRVSLKNILIK